MLYTAYCTLQTTYQSHSGNNNNNNTDAAAAATLPCAQDGGKERTGCAGSAAACTGARHGAWQSLTLSSQPARAHHVRRDGRRRDGAAACECVSRSNGTSEPSTRKTTMAVLNTVHETRTARPIFTFSSRPCYCAVREVPWPEHPKDS